MKQSNVQKNTIYNVIKSASAILFPLISFPYASRVLLTDGIGRVNFGNSVVSYVTLIASLGISTYAIRECAKVRDHKEKLEQTASQLFFINIATTLLAYLLLTLVLIFAEPLHDYRSLIILQSSCVIFTTIGMDWLNTAMEDFRFITIRTVVFQLLSLLAMFLFVKGPEDYMLYALISVLASSGANLTNLAYRRRFCRIQFPKTLDLRRHLPPILLLFSLILSQTVYVNSSTTILGLIRGDTEVGLYTTATKIYTIVNTMVASVAFVVMPQLSYLFAQENTEGINKLLRYGLGFIVTLGLPCIVGINVLCEEIIYVLAGEAYLAATPALHILTISLAASFIGGFIGNLILIPSGKEIISLLVSILSAVLSIVLNLLLIPRLGFIAAAMTTAIAEIVGMVISFFAIDKTHIRLENLRKLILPPVIGCLLIIAAAITVKLLIYNYMLRTLLTVAISVVLYLATLLLMKHDFTLNMVRKVIK